MNSIATALAILVFTGVFAYLFRYDYEPHDKLAVVISDRWTGAVKFCARSKTQGVCYAVFPPPEGFELRQE